MKNEEILKKAIEKAKLDSWGNPKFDFKGNLLEPDYNVIFSHSFVRAFWGEKEKYYYPIPEDPKMEQREPKIINQGWQYHLQQMVLEPEPLKYLERFLDEDED